MKEHVWANSFPTKEAMNALYWNAILKGVSSESIDFFIHRASLKPPQRLAVNLKIALFEMIDTEPSNVLQDGLTDKEKHVLAELSSKDLSLKDQETAHGIFNVHERWKLQKSLSSTFRKARSVSDFTPLGEIDEHGISQS